MKRFIWFFLPLLMLLMIGCEKKTVSPVDSDLLRKDKKSDFVYLSTTERPTELFKYSSITNESRQLTHSNGNIIDYCVNKFNGDIIYSAFNSQGGSDIWLLPSNDEQAELIISCNTETCFGPHIHPNGLILTFQKSTFSYNSDLILKNSKIVFFDLNKNEEIDFFGLSIENGSVPKWSPDGKFLAYFQANPGGIRIIDVLGSEILFLSEIKQQDFFTWGKDSNHFYFLTTEINNDQSVVSLHEVLISNKDFSQFAIELKESELVTGLKFGSNQDKVIIGIRYSSFSPAQKMVVFDLLNNENLIELSNPTASAGNYSWNSSGDQIIYQKFSFDSEIKTPEIAIWDLKDNVSKTIVSDAYFPSFLP